MDNNLRVVVVGPVGRGKSHLLYTIEKALQIEYGELIQIESNDLSNEKRLLGSDIAEWTRPTCEKISLFEMTEGSLAINRYKLTGGHPKAHPLHEMSGALLTLIEKHITGVTVNNNHSTPAFILSLEVNLRVFDTLCVNLERTAMADGADFVLEDVGMTGTLFATKLEGTVKTMRIIASEKIDFEKAYSNGSEHKLLTNLYVEYTPNTPK